MLGVGMNIRFVPRADFGTRIRDVCFASKAEVLRYECEVRAGALVREPLKISFTAQGCLYSRTFA